MKTGDLEPPWIVDISDTGTQANLNSVVSWRFVASVNGTVVFTDTAPTVTVDPVNTYKAAVKHTWSTGQTAIVGIYKAEIVAVWPSSREQTFPGLGTAVLTVETGID